MNESRTMLVVLLVCGLLMIGCIVLPVGLGAAFFFMASQRAEVAATERALAAEQVARAQAAQAQADAQAAQQALQKALSAPRTSPAPGAPPLPQAAELPAHAPDAPLASPPTIPLPPIGGLSDSDLYRDVQATVVATVLADVEKRKELYTSLKNVDAGVRQQMMDIFKAAGITQEHIDKIMAEGDKEGW